MLNSNVSLSGQFSRLAQQETQLAQQMQQNREAGGLTGVMANQPPALALEGMVRANAAIHQGMSSSIQDVSKAGQQFFNGSAGQNLEKAAQQSGQLADRMAKARQSGGLTGVMANQLPALAVEGLLRLDETATRGLGQVSNKISQAGHQAFKQADTVIGQGTQAVAKTVSETGKGFFNGSVGKNLQGAAKSSQQAADRMAKARASGGVEGVMANQLPALAVEGLLRLDAAATRGLGHVSDKISNLGHRAFDALF